ncbi:hypothetical protein AI29_11035 [bacteria symbiont BFo2 of Frankliniella occidentalis]|nr:hypothetical protein AI29_11035 [bacteria symbiont BFo2 of Frankliniella occidentalis]
MDYLISYLPDNECNPLLSPQRWANAMTYAVGIGVTHKGIRSGYNVWKLSFSKIRLMNKSAKLPYKILPLSGMLYRSIQDGILRPGVTCMGLFNFGMLRE